MRGTLHRPHAKEYCVKYQTDLGTLKGIRNDWAAVPANGSCSWENQQHGRGHHVKVVLRNLKAGTTINLKLVHEDGTEAPAFTVTKTGGSKPTMLIGADPREWRAGLSWTTKNREGPRRWHPAANCYIRVVEKGVEVPINKDPSARLCFLACSDDPVVIPVRIEVLSAVKGAGNYSRYSILCTSTKTVEHVAPGTHCESIQTEQGTAKLVSRHPGAVQMSSENPPEQDLGEIVSTWKSPPILIEAKWLPAAPVREQNKKRFNRSVSGDLQDSRKAANQTVDSKKPLHESPHVLVEAIKFLKNYKEPVPSPGNPCSKKKAPNKVGGVELEDTVKELEQALQEYKLRQAFSRLPLNGKEDFSNPKRSSSQEPPSSCGSAVAVIGYPAAIASAHRSPYITSPPRSPAQVKSERPSEGSKCRAPSMPAGGAKDRRSSGMFEKFEMLASAASDFGRLASLSPTLSAVHGMGHAVPGASKMAPLLLGAPQHGKHPGWNPALASSLAVRPPQHSGSLVNAAPFHPQMLRQLQAHSQPFGAQLPPQLFPGAHQGCPHGLLLSQRGAEGQTVPGKVSVEAAKGDADENPAQEGPAQGADNAKQGEEAAASAAESSTGTRTAKSPPLQAWTKRVRTNSWAQGVQVPAIR